MSHQRDPIEFYCDGPECDAKRVFVYGTSFIDAKAKLDAEGWRSFKRVGRDWTDYCPMCSPRAEREHQEHKRLEAERERIKQRNG